MGDMFDVCQAASCSGEAVMMPEESAHPVELDLAGTIRLPCTRAEEALVHYLADWLKTVDEDRFWTMEIAFLQFDYNPGNEHFTTHQIRGLRAFLAEQQGTARWDDTLIGLLTKFEAAEVQSDQ